MDLALLWFSVTCFGVRVSVTFHLTCVHIIFSSVSVAEWPPFGKIAANLVDYTLKDFINAKNEINKIY